jgi:hypothetical protein
MAAQLAVGYTPHHPLHLAAAAAAAAAAVDLAILQSVLLQG